MAMSLLERVWSILIQFKFEFGLVMVKDIDIVIVIAIVTSATVQFYTSQAMQENEVYVPVHCEPGLKPKYKNNKQEVEPI